MIFDIYENPRSGKKQVCTKDVFLNAISSDRLKQQVAEIRATEDKDTKQRLKAQLPCVSWACHCPNSNHRQSDAQPSGLYMVDIDHIKDWQGFKGTLATYQDRHNKLGIVAEFVTPSGNGYKLVAKFLPGKNLTTIEQWQQWLIDELGLNQLSFDTWEVDKACKDWSRLSFLVPFEEFTYIDYSLFTDDNARPDIKNPKLEGVDSEARDTEQVDTTNQQAQQKTDSDVGGNVGEYRFLETPLSEIAKMYIKHVGEPVEGTRHMYYLKMASQIRHICENNETILFSTLPELGQSADDRKRMCHDVCATKPNQQIPRDLYFTLVENGVIKRAGDKENDQVTDIEEEEVEASIEQAPEKTPRFPKVIASYAKISPKDFVWAQVNAVVCMLGANMNIEAKYIDRRYHTPTFHSVIVGPPSCGKSFIKETKEQLTANMKLRDAISDNRQRMWEEEYERTKNSKSPAPRPRLPRRLLMGVTSQVKILKRLDDTQGAHSLIFLPELDTWVKSNKGYQDKTDMLRQAYDNDMYGQDYMSDNSFSGEVKLTFNSLTSGTEGALYRMYPNPENGLVSRLTIAEITNQRFAEFQPFKMLSASQVAEIKSLVNWCNNITYVAPDDLENDLTRPRIDITEHAMFLHEVLMQWLDEKLQIARGNGDIALDDFRKRCAVMGFRAGLVGIGCYKLQLNDDRRKIITEFVRWFADMALINLIRYYGKQAEKMAETYGPVEKARTASDSLFDTLQDEFTLGDIEEKRLRFGLTARTQRLIFFWTKKGMITKCSVGKYKKTKNT